MLVNVGYSLEFFFNILAGSPRVMFVLELKIHTIGRGRNHESVERRERGEAMELRSSWKGKPFRKVGLHGTSRVELPDIYRRPPGHSDLFHHNFSHAPLSQRTSDATPERADISLRDQSTKTRKITKQTPLPPPQLPLPPPPIIDDDDGN